MVSKVIEDPLLRNRKHVFEDRLSAGELLAKRLEALVGRNAIVLAIPAGGIPVGYIVAKRLGIPFDVAVVRKIHIPWNPEAGFGAVTWDGVTIFNVPLLRQLMLSRGEVERCVAMEKRETLERFKKFRGDERFPDLRGKRAVIVDDGLASGYTMLAAVRSTRGRAPTEIFVAVPTSSMGAIELLSPEVDRIVCLNVRDEYPYAVADAYQLWYDLSDDEVMSFLRELRR